MIVRRFTLQLGTAIFAVMMLISCSANGEDSEDLTDESREEITESGDETNVSEAEDESSDDAEGDDEEVKLNDEDYDPEDHQGLSLGETAEIQDYLVSGLHYEITLNKVESIELVNNQEPKGDFYALVEVTLKNLHEDETMDAGDGFGPGFGTEMELQAPFNSIYLDEDDYVDLVEDLNFLQIQGEMAPGEEVTGTYLYDVDESDEYHFAYNDKMVTFASWNVSPDEIEER